MHKDIIFIKNLTIQAIIGVYEWEKQFKQPLIFDLEMTTDLSKAAASDALKDTVNYKQVSDEIIELIEANQFELLESVSDQVCQHIFQQYPSVEKIELTINKPNAVPQAEAVGIKMVRFR